MPSFIKIASKNDYKNLFLPILLAAPLRSAAISLCQKCWSICISEHPKNQEQSDNPSLGFFDIGDFIAHNKIIKLFTNHIIYSRKQQI